MDLFFLLASIFFFVWIIRNAFFWVWLWQLKEYRLDRILIHLKETEQGKKLLFSPLAFLKWLVVASYVLVVLNNSLLTFYQIIIFLIFFYEAISAYREKSTEVLKMPIISFKAIFIAFISLLFISVLFLVPLVEKFLWILLLDRILTLIIAFLVFLLYFPTEFYRDYKIKKAAKKISSFKNLLVIGITGSYGKSSTKNYIAKILEEKFNVLKTRGTNNTPIGIANTIISGLSKNTQIFVVEMGAYKRGEIKKICEIVHPKIGIITAVNDQHLSLFGNLQTTMDAKYELIESLPNDGIAMFNSDNKNSYELYKKTNKKKVLYGIEKLKNGNDSIFASDIIVKKTSIDFEVSLKKDTLHLKTPLLGVWNAEDLLPGIYIANYLGMKKDEIKKAVSSLLPLPKTMTYKKLSTGVAIIDDTFNANPASVSAALEYMKIYKGKKILVLQPMIELGKNAEQDHYQAGRKISEICDYLFLTNKNFYEPVLGGIKDTGGKCLVKMGNLKEFADFVNQNTKTGDIVVFEGKEAAFFLDKILSMPKISL